MTTYTLFALVIIGACFVALVGTFAEMRADYERQLEALRRTVVEQAGEIDALRREASEKEWLLEQYQDALSAPCLESIERPTLAARAAAFRN